MEANANDVGLRPINTLSLCSGAGGLDLGLKLACPAVRTVAYVEIEAYACEVLAARMEAQQLDAAPIWSNLRTFDGRRWRGVVDLLTGGYPCQPFSVAGKQLGVNDPRHLWPDIKRIIDESEPGTVFFENVANHLRIGFDVVARELQSLGYRVAAGLFTAEEVGAPHKRERLFILADHDRRGCLRSGLHIPKWRSQQAVPDDHWTGEGVVDADDSRLEGRSRSFIERADQFPAWPPSPTDADAWSRVLDIDASLEPALCRMADGMAHRVDRLRLCGNGVVPQQAALAFRTLASDLMRSSN